MKRYLGLILIIFSIHFVVAELQIVGDSEIGIINLGATTSATSCSCSGGNSTGINETTGNTLWWGLDASNDDLISSSWDMHNYGFFNIGNSTFTGADYLFNRRGITSFYWNSSSGSKFNYGYLDPDNSAVDYVVDLVLSSSKSYYTEDVQYGPLGINKLGGSGDDFNIYNADPTNGGIVIEGGMLDIDSNNGAVLIGADTDHQGYNVSGIDFLSVLSRIDTTQLNAENSFIDYLTIHEWINMTEGDIIRIRNATAQNIFAGNICYSNGVNCTASSSNYNLTYDLTSRDVTANRSAWFSTYNVTYNGLVNNASYLSTFNTSYSQLIPTFIEIQTSKNSTNSTIWNDTIFSFTLLKNMNYTLQCEIQQNAQAGTTGSQYAVNTSTGGALTSSYTGFSNVIAGTGVLQNACLDSNMCTSLGTGQITSSNGRTTISGRYMAGGTNGVVLIQLRSEVSGSWVNIYPRSWCKLWQEF